MKPACLDSSIYVRALGHEPGTDAATALLEELLTSDHRFVGPALLPFEVLSALLNRFRRGLMAPADLAGAVDAFGRLGPEIVDFTSLLGDAWRLAEALGLSRIYDTSFLAVALKLCCPLWTADGRFFHAAARKYPSVRLVG